MSLGVIWGVQESWGSHLMGSPLLPSSCDPNGQLPSRRGGAAVLGLTSGRLRGKSGLELCLEASGRGQRVCVWGCILRHAHSLSSRFHVCPGRVTLNCFHNCSLTKKPRVCAGGKWSVRALWVWVEGTGMQDKASV